MPGEHQRFYVYTLYSEKDKRLYTGFSTNLRNRLSTHARGKVKLTAHRHPLTLIDYDYFVNEGDARAREVFLKSGFGREQLKQSLKRTLGAKAVSAEES
jgi:putative endonuclease